MSFFKPFLLSFLSIYLRKAFFVFLLGVLFSFPVEGCSNEETLPITEEKSLSEAFLEASQEVLFSEKPSTEFMIVKDGGEREAFHPEARIETRRERYEKSPEFLHESLPEVSFSDLVIKEEKNSHDKFPKDRCSGKIRALWISPAWAYVAYPQRTVEELKDFLVQRGINTIYLNVGSISQNGRETIYGPKKWSIRKQSRYAQRLLSIFHHLPHRIDVFAWMSASTDPQRGNYRDLTLSIFRRNLVALSSDILKLGFDGIHLNIEPFPDRHYCPRSTSCLQGINRVHLAYEFLLKTLRSKIARSQISITSGTYFEYGDDLLWTLKSFRAILPLVGQLVTLNYDISILAPNASKYQQTLKKTLSVLTSALPHESSHIVFGLPNYRSTGSPHHRPHENLLNAYLAFKQSPLLFQKISGFSVFIDLAWGYPTGSSFSLDNLRHKPDWSSWKKLANLLCP